MSHTPQQTPELKPTAEGVLAPAKGSAVHYHTHYPTETGKGTQVCLGRDVLGFIWHLPNSGFRWAHSHKLYTDEHTARIAVVRSALKRHQEAATMLLIELGRLNND